MNDEVDMKKRKMLIVLIVILSILLIGAVLVVAGQITSAKKEVTSQTQTPLTTKTVSNTVIASATSTVSVSATPTVTKSAVSADADQAKVAATNFMQAKKDRSLGEAKPYMTYLFYQSTDQVAFAGSSSPSMSRFEIVSSNVKDFQTFTIVVKSYWLLQGEDAGTINYTLEVMKVGNDYLVNKFDQQ